MDGLITFVIIAVVIFRIIAAYKKKAGNFTEDTDSDDMREVINNMKRRLSDAARNANKSETSSVGEGYKPLDHTTIAPTVKPHSPTVHSDENVQDCEAHRPPESSEGSEIRAHSASAHLGKECEMHEEVVSTEGEAEETYLERLKKKKAEMDAKEAFNHRYDQKPVKQQQPVYEINLGKDSLINAFILGEVLGEPKSRR